MVVLLYLSLIFDTAYSHRNDNLKEDVQIVWETNRRLHNMEMEFSVMLVDRDRSKQCFLVKGDARKTALAVWTNRRIFTEKENTHIHDNTLVLYRLWDC